MVYKLPIFSEAKTWLACLIDAEGAIFISKVKTTKTKRGYILVSWITVSNSCRQFLLHAQKLMGCASLNLIPDKRKISKAGFRWKDRWMLALTSGYIEKLLPLIQPYLIVKKHQAELMMKFLGFRRGSRKVYKTKPRADIDLAEMVELYKDGWNPMRLAKKYNCHYTTITNWLRTLGEERVKNFRGEYPQELLNIYDDLRSLNRKGQPVQEVVLMPVPRIEAE